MSKKPQKKIPKKPVKKRRQCSKNRWQGFERFIAFAIDGKRVLGQAAKFSGRKDTFGDAQSELVVAECKARDPAPKKWRDNNPQVPYNKIKLETIWLEKIKTESEAINKIGILAYNIKYSGLANTFMIKCIKDIHKEMGYIGPKVIEINENVKSFSFDIDEVPCIIKINDSYFKCQMMRFMIKMENWIKYDDIDKLIDDWKAKSKEKVDVKDS